MAVIRKERVVAIDRQTPKLEQGTEHWIGRFRAMASPCELLIESKDREEAERLLQVCADEAWRIEEKFSRYQTDNMLDRINASNGASLEVDEETAGLIHLAFELYRLSNGKFDITSGILRKVWNFDGGDQVPSQHAVEELLPFIGMEKISWQPPVLCVPENMQIDFGGIGKEYAVDRCIQLIAEESKTSCLVNFAGDLRVSQPRKDGAPWRVGIEGMAKHIELTVGALATSGDVRRYIKRGTKRYSHILNPLTGWPIEHAPSSITVLSDTCIEAGLLATLASLEGSQAQLYLEHQHVRFWLAD